MSKDINRNNFDSQEPIEVEATVITESAPVSIGQLYAEVRAKKERDKAEKKQRKAENKVAKTEKEMDLELYDDYLGNYTEMYPETYDPFLREQTRMREGNIIPEVLDLNLYNDSGFLFGTKFEPNGYVGKPAGMDGHILVVGRPGDGKTEAILKPTMMTWKDFQVYVDVKGDLSVYWKQLNGYTNKKLKILSPGKSCSCGYDPYGPFQNGDVAGNARILALALMPSTPNVDNPIWNDAAQNFLTGAIIYHYNLECSFAESMATILLTSVTDMIGEVMKSDDTDAKVYMNKLSDMDGKVIGNIGMELSNLAALINDPAILSIFCTGENSDMIDWSELNTATEPFDIILEFTEENLERWEPLMQLMLNQLVKSLEKRPARTYKASDELSPVLVMLDEFPRLGKVSAIQNGLKTLRSRGVTFALFVQSFAGLDEIYGPIAARVIADVCKFHVVLGIGDVATQEWYSKGTGDTESTRRSVSANHDPLNGRISGYSRNINETREPIIYPHEFRTLKDVVLLTPHGFCRLNKAMFYQNKKLFLFPQLVQNRELWLQSQTPNYAYNWEDDE